VSLGCIAMQSETIPAYVFVREQSDVAHALSRASLRLAITVGMASTYLTTYGQKNNSPQNSQRLPRALVQFLAVLNSLKKTAKHLLGIILSALNFLQKMGVLA